LLMAAPMAMMQSMQHGRFLIRLCDLVEAPRGRSGQFFCLPGRGGHLGGHQPPSGGVVGGGPRATRRCHRRCRADLCPWPGRGGRFFSRGCPQRYKWLDRTGGVRRFWARKF
jgi:hypothetical protein